MKSMKPQLGMTTKGADTARNDEWSELSDLCAQHTSQIVGEVIYPRRTLTTGDLDGIFAGRPLSTARQRASVICKIYLTSGMASVADVQAKKECLSKTAVLRKALAAYLNDSVTV